MSKLEIFRSVWNWNNSSWTTIGRRLCTLTISPFLRRYLESWPLLHRSYFFSSLTLSLSLSLENFQIQNRWYSTEIQYSAAISRRFLLYWLILLNDQNDLIILCDAVVLCSVEVCVCLFAYNGRMKMTARCVLANAKWSIWCSRNTHALSPLFVAHRWHRWPTARNAILSKCARIIY